MSNQTEKPADSTSQEQLTGHDYDGIEEYDNPTPGWWVAIFVVTVVFAAGYFVYYHSQVPDRSVYDRYEESAAAEMKLKLTALGVTELTVNEPNMLQWMANKDYMQYGRSVFKGNCANCHGDQGQGLVGPNMTDDYYKNIKKLTDIPRVVTNGAANGAMPAWGTRLSSVDIALAAAYVASLRGTELSGPRGHEGERIPDWPPLPTSMPAAQTTTGKTPSK